MLMAIVAELAIHLISKKIQVVFLDQSSHLQQFLVGIKITRRVVGVANHDGLGARRDDLLKFLDGRQGKARLDVAGNGDNLGIAQLGEGVIIGVVRLWDDDFVARVKAHCEGHLQSLATARGDKHLVRRDIDTMPMVIVAQGTTIGRDARRVAVFQHTVAGRKFLGGLSQSLQSTLRGLDVGLADVEVIHMDTAFLGGIGKRNKFTDSRLRQIQTFFGYLWHKCLI